MTTVYPFRLPYPTSVAQSRGCGTRTVYPRGGVQERVRTWGRIRKGRRAWVVVIGGSDRQVVAMREEEPKYISTELLKNFTV